MDKSKVIFGNEISNKAYKKACKSKKKYQKKYGDDSQVDYKVCLKKNAYIGDSLGVRDVLLSAEQGEEFDVEKIKEWWDRYYPYLEEYDEIITKAEKSDLPF